MNFFAHYYFQNKPQNSWHNAGLLFPDLLRIFSNNQRISEKSGLDLTIDNTEYKNLATGIQQHFSDDSKFHNWHWFIKKNHELAITIRESKLGFKRDWILAHLLIELTIDHVLVSENEIQVKELYMDLMACNKPGWELFFKINKLEELDIWFERFTQFNERQYIFTFKDTENVIYALNRIYLSTGIGQFDDTQNKFLVVLLNNILPEIKLKINELHKILK